jgi:hypothetical protein
MLKGKGARENKMRLNRTQEYIELTVYLMDDKGISPCQCEDFDEYEDLVFDAAEKAFGPPNASQKSVLRKWLRDDWAQYQYMAEIKTDAMVGCVVGKLGV